MQDEQRQESSKNRKKASAQPPGPDCGPGWALPAQNPAPEKAAALAEPSENPRKSQLSSERPQSFLAEETAPETTREAGAPPGRPGPEAGPAAEPACWAPPENQRPGDSNHGRAAERPPHAAQQEPAAQTSFVSHLVCGPDAKERIGTPQPAAPSSFGGKLLQKPEAASFVRLVIEETGLPEEAGVSAMAAPPKKQEAGAARPQTPWRAAAGPVAQGPPRQTSEGYTQTLFAGNDGNKAESRPAPSAPLPPPEAAFSAAAQAPEVAAEATAPAGAGPAFIEKGPGPAAPPVAAKEDPTEQANPKQGERAQAAHRPGREEQPPVQEAAQLRVFVAERRRRGAAVAALFMAGILLAGALLALGVRQRQQQYLTPALPAGQQHHLALQEPPVEQEGLSTVEIVQKLAPSVVTVDIYRDGELMAASSASGIVFTADGYIVTNAHVVEEADAIRVVLNTGQGYTAQMIGMDLRQDLAVLKISAEGLAPAEFGDSDQVQIGQRAVAIGNAAGILPGSPTQGIISGVNREVTMTISDGSRVRMTLLQTDAAINPGNSGGALVNAYGQVIGINVAKLQSADIDNIGFAIPTRIAQPVIDVLMQAGELPRPPVLGVSILALNETAVQGTNLPTQGLYIAEMQPECDLPRHGVEVGDVILQAEGRPMLQTRDLTLAIEQKTAGDTIALQIYKPSTGQTIVVEGLLYAPPAPAASVSE